MVDFTNIRHTLKLAAVQTDLHAIANGNDSQSSKSKMKNTYIIYVYRFKNISQRSSEIQSYTRIWCILEFAWHGLSVDLIVVQLCDQSISIGDKA